uniref:Uncharacterized protein n=1 Tax=Lactuca sativa TaxID=4236 RepID=A0A9R1X951_LACSA|nr:hypothetical protein LSAT_V11C600320290 [Lactuca sativa]
MNSSLKLGSGSTSTRQNYAGKQGDCFQFTLRLGVEFNGRDSPQSAERQITLQTTSASQSQTRQYLDNVVRPSIGMTTCSLFNFLRSFL